MKKIYSFLAIALLIIVSSPIQAFASTQSGGGYTVNGQATAVSGAATGSGYTSEQGSAPITQSAVTGGGYTSYGTATFTPPVTVTVTPTPSGGGGGGGGGGSGSYYSSTPTSSTTTYSAGCTSGTGFSTTTGLACTVVTTGGANCVIGQVFSTVTGARCTSWTGGTGITCSDILAVSQPVHYGLKYLNKKSDVMIVEKFLNTYENANLAVNGVYELVDYNAVVKWQEKYASVILKPQNLKKGTGYIYTYSIAQMKRQQKSACAVTTPVVTTPTPVPTTANLCFTTDLKAPANGPLVTAMQKFLAKQGLLAVTPNGNFGPSTIQAVRDFQSLHPESYKGLVGPTGWFYSQTRAVANKLNGCVVPQ